MAKKKTTNGTGNTSERRVSLEMEVELTPDEYRAEADILASETLEILQFEEAKKAYDAETNKKIKAIEEKRDPRAAVVKTGKKKKLVECIEIANFDRNVIETRNAATGEGLFERPMEAEERDRMAQGQLPWADHLDDVDLPQKAQNDVEVPPGANGSNGEVRA